MLAGMGLLAFIFLVVPVNHVFAATIPSPTSSDNVPDFCETPTKTSVGSGNWSSASTWSPSGVPTTNDKVVVAAGHTITYDVSSANALDCLGVKGNLTFRTDISTKVTVGTILIYSTGKMTVGTAAIPIAGNVTAEIVTADKGINLTIDPDQYGTGILVFGRIEMNGVSKTSWTRMTSELLAGQSTLQVQDATGWNVGDRILVPDTRDLFVITNYTPEIFNITAINGLQITLNHAAIVEHPGARNADSIIERYGPVANLSRNVSIRSANPASGTRGHFWTNGNATITIKNVAITDYGRTTNEVLSPTNHIGRYALHLHFLNGAAGIQNNVIERATRWGITIHHSNGKTVSNNVIYDAWGAGLMTEDST
jgi:cell migration-inducing and hyaluronan-binding protein